MIFSCYEEFQIHNPAERFLWILFFLAALLSSIIGDVLILIASVRHHAILLNRFIVIVIQHIAFCDLVRSLSFLLPTMLGLLANGWVWGQVLAYVIFFFNIVTFQATNLLICTLTSTKVLVLLQPIRARCWSSLKIHLLCAVIWFLSSIVPTLRLIDNLNLRFDYRLYHLSLGIASQWMRTTLNVAVVVFICIPLCIVTLTTFTTSIFLAKSWKLSKQTGARIRWHGMVTVNISAIVFFVSILPLSVSLIASFSKLTLISDAEKTVIFRRVSEFLTTLNIVSNFYIYCLTLPSFRNFVRKKTTTMVSSSKIIRLSTMRSANIVEN